jgi:DNA repair exonuclease SbcCD ATPase subunit
MERPADCKPCPEGGFCPGQQDCGCEAASVGSLRQQLAAAEERAERAEGQLNGALAAYEKGREGWKSRAEAAEAKVKDLESEVDEVTQVAEDQNTEIRSLYGQVEAAEATVAGLRAALEWQREALDSGYFTRADGGWSCQDCARYGETPEAVAHADECAFGRIESALRATPSQHAARIRERVLREAADKLRRRSCDDETARFYDVLNDMADEAAKEAL